MSSSSRASPIRCRFGDYLFVHAGIRPGVELDQQSQSDLRWIREPFLFDETDHGFVVVHGHTISDEVEERPEPDRHRHRRLSDRRAHRAGDRRTERWLLDTRGGSKQWTCPLRLI